MKVHKRQSRILWGSERLHRVTGNMFCILKGRDRQEKLIQEHVGTYSVICTRQKVNEEDTLQTTLQYKGTSRRSKNSNPEKEDANTHSNNNSRLTQLSVSKLLEGQLPDSRGVGKKKHLPGTSSTHLPQTRRGVEQSHSDRQAKPVQQRKGGSGLVSRGLDLNHV